jgi:hypothetical protein
MPSAPAPLPDGLGEAFGVAEARRAGASAARLRASDLEAPFWGVRRRVAQAAEVDDTPLGRTRSTRERVLRDARTFAPLLPEGAFYAGRTAAVLHGATVAHDGDLEVAVLAPGRTLRREGIRGRKVAPVFASVRTVGGLPTASPAATWAMLGDELDVHGLIRLGDELVRIPRDAYAVPQPDQQKATPAQLRAVVAAGPRRGVVALRAALERIRVGSMSLLETDWRIQAEDAGLPEPDLDVEVRGPRGLLLGIADGAYPAYGVLVEVEGDHHRTDVAQWNRDIRKHADFAAVGFEVVRLTRSHIGGRTPSAPRLLRAVLLRHGWRP